MLPQIIGVKELQKSLKKVQIQVSKGQYFVVVSRSRPVFSIIPPPSNSLEEDLRKTNLYSDNFIEELVTAEDDIKNGRVYQINSLDELLVEKKDYVPNSNN